MMNRFKIKNKIPKLIITMLPILKILKIRLKDGSSGKPNLLEWREITQPIKKEIKIMNNKAVIKSIKIMVS